MKKIILITGATDGIGLETARQLAAERHNLLLHGRNSEKLDQVVASISSTSEGTIESYLSDLSEMKNAVTLGQSIAKNHDRIDVVINNAGVYNAPNPKTRDGLDLRFAVNTFAPWLLTQRLLPLLGRNGRVINLSSAAQSTVDLEALIGKRQLSDHEAYSQSKLALTMWSRALAKELGSDAPVIIAVNPGSLLASKMVKEAFGVPGSDLAIGADILCRTALSDEFANASGRYFDNDAHRFSQPHPDARDERKCEEIVRVMEGVLQEIENRGRQSSNS